MNERIFWSGVEHQNQNEVHIEISYVPVNRLLLFIVEPMDVESLDDTIHHMLIRVPPGVVDIDDNQDCFLCPEYAEDVFIYSQVRSRFPPMTCGIFEWGDKGDNTISPLQREANLVNHGTAATSTLRNNNAITICNYMYIWLYWKRWFWVKYR